MVAVPVAVVCGSSDVRWWWRWVFGGMAVTVTVTVAEVEVVAAEVVWAVAVVAKVDVGSDRNGVAMVVMVFFFAKSEKCTRLQFFFLRKDSRFPALNAPARVEPMRRPSLGYQFFLSVRLRAAYTPSPKLTKKMC